MTKHPTIWYVIADGAHARVIQRNGQKFVSVTELASIDAHKNASDFGSDSPGRSVESMGTTRHAIEPRSNPKDRAKRDFAHLVAQTINEGANAGSFAQWGLVALPDTLNAIKEALNPLATTLLAGEEHKDLVKLPEAELRERLVALVGD